MKNLLIVFACVFHQVIFAQFGVVVDKDGYVNIRDTPTISNNISDRLTTGEIVFCFENEDNWYPIEYKIKQASKGGYIHKSRVKFIQEFNEIPFKILTDSLVEFKTDSIKLLVTKENFNPENKKLEYYYNDSSRNENNWLKKINGKEIWGLQRDIPKMQYGKMILTIDKNSISLPIDNLFEPNLDYTKVNIDKKSNTIYISTLNSDGAGAYMVLWVISNGEFKKQLKVIPF